MNDVRGGGMLARRRLNQTGPPQRNRQVHAGGENGRLSPSQARELELNRCSVVAQLPCGVLRPPHTILARSPNLAKLSAMHSHHWFSGLLAWILAVGTAGAAEEASSPSAPLCVMTYNLRYASQTPPNAWPQRRPLVKACIERVRPDVIGTQEGV
jgi:hypothetical protein